MADFKKKVSKLLAGILGSCEKSTFLISKKHHEQLSFKENIFLKIHLLTCQACRSFSDQIGFLKEGIYKLKTLPSVFHLSDEEKAKIQQNLDDKIKK